MKSKLLAIGLIIGTCSFSQVTLIPDENFEGYLVSEGIDTDGLLNGQVLTADIEDVVALSLVNLSIEDLTGLEDFTALEVLDCSENFNLEAINLSSSTSLREFYAQFCAFTTIDFSNNVNLELVYVPHNNLTSLTLTSHPALENLTCGNPLIDLIPFNQISTLDLSGTPNLLFLDVSFMGSMSSLDLSQIPLLETFYGSYCSFNALDLSDNSALETLVLGGFDSGIVSGQSNNLTNLDLSNNPNLTTLDVELTNINSLNLKNGNNTVLVSMKAHLNDPLFCILVDDAIAANGGASPYNTWVVDAQVTYDDEECVLTVAENTVESIWLYPNPAAQTINLSLPLREVPTGISIYATTGELLLQPVLKNNSIDVSELASGMYILSLQYNQEISNKTFVKR